MSGAWKLASFTALTLGWWSAATPVHADGCRLPMFWNSELLFDEAQYVFTARAQAAKLTIEYLPEGLAAFGPSVKVTYELRTAFKGAPPQTGTVWASRPEERGCGEFPVLVGQNYLFMVMPFPAESPKHAQDGAIGLLSLLGSQMLLWGAPEAEQQSLATARALAEQQR